MPADDVLEAARDRYAVEQPRFRRAALAIAEEIKEVARKVGVYARVEGREKSLDSFVKKSITKPYDQPWEETTDKAGARAIVADASTLYPLVEALEAHWGSRCGARQDKSLDLDDRVFDYSGVHLQVVVPREDTDTETIECEVQVRTAAQDAWSVLSHQFLYKPAIDLPKESKRAMYRLVALVEVFDEEVKRTVATTLADPEYPQARLLHDAERAFFQVGTWDYDRELTHQVLDVAVRAVPVREQATYGDRLLEFVDEQRERIASWLAAYGPGSDLGSSTRYVLLSQPEALVLIERAEHAEMLLASVIDEAGPDMRRLVEPVLAAWGRPLPPEPD